MNHSHSHIEECLRLIEAKWRRGPREDWTSYDFEKLNSAIFDATGVSLSVSTLKRLCGKVSYSNLPSTHTLNTIARFAGFEDWSDFRHRHSLPMSETSPPMSETSPPMSETNLPNPESPQSSLPNPESFQSSLPNPESFQSSLPNPAPGQPSPLQAQPTPRLARWWPVLFLPLAILLYSLLNTHTPAPPAPNSRDYRFSCNKVVSEGVPNSVVFHYRTPVSAADSVFISQTWDISRRVAVPPNGSDHSAIYYYPGYFVAKLIVDTQVVLTHNLMITSDGWLATSDAQPVPIYFKKEEVARKKGVEIDSATLARYHLNIQPNAPMLRIFYMKDLGDLSNADFSFETTLRTGFAQGSGVCQNVQVLIQCKDDIFIIPLAAKACVGDLHLYAAGTGATSMTADLSGFGCDLTKWTSLRVVSNNRHVTFLVNGKVAYSLYIPHEPTDIVGVQYRFAGTCAVKNARFITGDRIIDLK